MPAVIWTPAEGAPALEGGGAATPANPDGQSSEVKISMSRPVVFQLTSAA